MGTLKNIIDMAKGLGVAAGIASPIVAGAAVAGAASIAVAATNSKRPHVDRLGISNLVFPSDLDQYAISIAFDFKQYQRRSIFSQPYEKALGTIRLPIPKNLTDNFKMDWDSSATAGPVTGVAIENMLSMNQGNSNLAGENPMGMLGKLGQAANDIAGAGFMSITDKLLENAKKLPGLGDINLNQVLQPLGLVQNPFLTVMFKQPTFKSFNFSWKLAPKKPEESRTLNSIINTFKYHMLPDISSAPGGTLLNYPSILRISFFNSDNYLFRFKPCVIQDLRINYAPAQTPSFFKGDQNAPTEVELSLTLLEIEYWTKVDFQRNYVEGIQVIK